VLNGRNKVKILTLAEFKKMFEGAFANLGNKKEIVNKLNVFPVPDGDTGTNMFLTLKTAMEEVKKHNPKNLKEFGKAICEGALIGGRGNSGVILSQIFKGFFDYIDGKEEISIPEFAEALLEGSKTAYKAVIKPVEGTILTVMNAMAQKAIVISRSEADFEHLLKELLQESEIVLKKTPELLPVLKEAGVVDSGGQGLVFITEGMLMGLEGNISTEKTFEEEIEEMDKTALGGKLEFRYDTVLLTTAPDIDPQRLQKDLEQFGDSIVVAKTGELTKIHVHSNEPYKVMEFVMQYGDLREARIENMQEEQEEFLKRTAPASTTVTGSGIKRPFCIISVSQGEGFDKIFSSIGVDFIVSGGQTMNPSINDILSAIAKCKKDKVVILPNNSNIILAAKEAAKLTKDKSVVVLPTKNMVQAIPIILSFNIEEKFDANVKRAQEILNNIHSFAVTYSVRDTTLNGMKLRKGDILGVADGDIVIKGTDPDKVILELFKKYEELVKNYEIVGIYYGRGIKKEKAEAIGKKIEDMFPDIEVDVSYGGQPFYFYLISIE
jgi:DAK2 domain fusion protein YloV